MIRRLERGEPLKSGIGRMLKSLDQDRDVILKYILGVVICMLQIIGSSV